MFALYTSIRLLTASLSGLVSCRAWMAMRRLGHAETSAVHAETALNAMGDVSPKYAAGLSYALGAALAKRDRAQATARRWKDRENFCRKMSAAACGWSGRKIPYLAGVIDTAAVAFGGEKLGLVTLPSWELVLETAKTLAAGIGG